MSFSDALNGPAERSVPAWAQGASAPLVPSVDMVWIKRSVQTDVKELRKSGEMLAKLAAGAKKRPASAQTAAEQFLSVSSGARERARATSRMLREALAQVQDGTAEHAQLSAFSADFKEALVKFQQQYEASAHLVTPVAPTPTVAPADIEQGGGAVGQRAVSSSGPGGSSSSHVDEGGIDYQVHDQQMAQVACNEAVIAERSQGINQLSHSVQEVAEIFNDLALLVNEQGTQIDNIQTNIETAHSQTTRGVKELARASKSQRKARSRMCIIAICVMAVLIILVLVLKFGMNRLR